MKSLFFSVAGFGLLAMTAHAQPPAKPSATPFQISLSDPERDGAEAAPVARAVPPADLEDDDSGDYMKRMTPAELEALYARHDAEVARLMAAAPDEELFGQLAMIDPSTGERVSIDLIAF